MNLQNQIQRKGRKIDQVIQGARDVFLMHGFQNANMDQIARVSQVSKATVYSYFPDKQTLFVEVVKNECLSQTDLALEVIDRSAPVAQVLTQAGTHLVHFFLSEFAQRIFRICIAEADRFPELGRHFYSSGPLLGRATLREFFHESMEKGDLKIPDVDLAADQFVELCKADLWLRGMLAISTDFSKSEIDRVVNGAVDTFLARYGT